MKLLHTADWHLGARLGRHDRLPDQQAAVRAVLAAARAQEPDLILHAGDLFDAARPVYEALETGVQALGRLAEIAPTVVLSGNHDSPALFRVIDRLAEAARPRRLWMVSEPRVLTFEELAPEPVAVACVPFISAGAGAAISATDPAAGDPERPAGTYADTVRTLNDRLLEEAQHIAGARGIVLYAAHLHLHGARPGRSERRLTVGEDYAAHAAGLERALYCAFGHIHDPQLLPGGVARGRYAGSLVPLDYGEQVQRKQVVLVSIAGEVRAEPCEIATGRPLVEFDGTLEELQRRAADGGLDDHILKARVRSADPIPDLADRLFERSPRCVVFDLHNAPANQAAQAVSAAAGPGEEPALVDQFLEWRASAARGVRAPHEQVAELFSAALAGAGGETAPDLGVAELDTRARRVLAALAAAPAGG